MRAVCHRLPTVVMAVSGGPDTAGLHQLSFSGITNRAAANEGLDEAFLAQDLQSVTHCVPAEPVLLHQVGLARHRIPRPELA